MEGKVWLVGAGPGEKGLLTVKGKSIIEDADVIVYDHLVGKEILSALDQEKKLINVGKIAGHHPIPQEQINEILIEEAKKGQRVVRLKGGDPFLFGRGGEELWEIAKREIPFEVVPGVTSPLAVPAYGGIPVTHRDYASSVHIVTGHKKKEKENNINYEALVETKGTLVFLMGVTALGEIRKNLLKAGMRPDMPAAIVQEGTTAAQKTVLATLDTLENRAKEEKVKPPAVIVVGEVCSLATQLSWYEKLPLQGMKIILTRPKELISTLSEKLRTKGAQVWEIPAIETVPVSDNPKLSESFKNIEKYDWIAFTSQVGVRVFFEQAEKECVDIRKFAHAKFAVIGEGTKKALKQRGIFADLMPLVYDGESLGNALATVENIEGNHILIPRARKANELLVPILEKAGAIVTDVPIYDTIYRECKSLDLVEEMEKGSDWVVVFTSSSTVDGFAAVTKGMDCSKITAACIGRQTAQTAEKYGMECYIAKKATLDSLVDLIEDINKILKTING